MKYYKDIFEVIFFARGGQGAKTAAEVVAQAAVIEGKHIQAFPFFGPERSGAPTRTYLKISDKPITNHEPIIDPDVVVVLDDTLLDSQNVIEGLEKNENLIINTTREPEAIAKQLGFNGMIHAVDATGISQEIIGQPRPNTVILGKLVNVTEIADLENIKEAFSDIFSEKIGHELTQKNIEAIEKAYDVL